MSSSVSGIASAWQPVVCSISRRRSGCQLLNTMVAVLPASSLCSCPANTGKAVMGEELQRWVANLKKLPSWPKVNEVMYGFAGSMKDKKFENL